MDPVSINAANYGSNVGLLLLTDDDDRLKNYLPTAASSQATKPLAVVAPQSFDRVVAQSGTFTVSHPAHVANDMVAESSSHIQSWTIPLTQKQSIRNELYKLGVNEASVYPDLDRISTMIRNEVA